MNSHPYFTPSTKTNSKYWYLINLTVRAKTIKLLEENVEEIICDSRLEHNFLNYTHTKCHKVPIIKENKVCFSKAAEK